jgi:hypothetical protein
MYVRRGFTDDSGGGASTASPASRTLTELSLWSSRLCELLHRKFLPILLSFSFRAFKTVLVCSTPFSLYIFVHVSRLIACWNAPSISSNERPLCRASAEVLPGMMPCDDAAYSERTCSPSYCTSNNVYSSTPRAHRLSNPLPLLCPGKAFGSLSISFHPLSKVFELT